jgi:hypothetical protein
MGYTAFEQTPFCIRALARQTNLATPKPVLSAQAEAHLSQLTCGCQKSMSSGTTPDASTGPSFDIESLRPCQRSSTRSKICKRTVFCKDSLRRETSLATPTALVRYKTHRHSRVISPSLQLQFAGSIVVFRYVNQILHRILDVVYVGDKKNLSESVLQLCQGIEDIFFS